SNILLPYQFKNALKKSQIPLDFDLIIVPTPPITMIKVAFWLKKQSKAKLYLILRDIFPQNGVDLKMMSQHGLPYYYFRKLEKKLYRQSDSIGCMSPANVNYVKRHNTYVDTSKLHLLPNWETLKESHEIVEEETELRKRYGLLNKFVAIHAGNIGLPQQVENIIELAETVQHLNDLVFLIIGWGTEKNKIIALAKEKNLENVIFMDSVNRNELGKILKISDIGLISLNKNFTIPNFPSKVNAYYRYKLPILSALDANTDFGVIQENIGCGFWSVSGDTDALKKNLLRLYENEELRREMGVKGYNYMKNNLTPNHAYQTIVNQFKVG
ncbi:MAG: glycosyltransferase family 4 protein, partial [Flavobacteriaceae bacterium]|nr:glycosyltransferase family 4 protein [Flavobacteriaceae bacterium]